MFKTASACYLVFVRGRVYKRFLITNVSVGNITLFRKQHVAREIRVQPVLHCLFFT